MQQFCSALCIKTRHYTRPLNKLKIYSLTIIYKLFQFCKLVTSFNETVDSLRIWTSYTKSFIFVSLIIAFGLVECFHNKDRAYVWGIVGIAYNVNKTSGFHNIIQYNEYTVV